MKFTLNWLKDHLDTNASLDTITTSLTAIGLELEGVEDASKKLSAFTVAKIIEATRHPEADKLQVCKVESNNGILQIVCGAPNARAGLFVALAQEGVYIPGSDFTIKKTKIRGVESNGMLCSFEELGITGDSAGIIELPEAPIGSSVAAALGIDDPVIDIAITPNRADCLGVRGVARDLAAAGIGTLKPLATQALKLEGASPISVSITTSECQQFIGCYISGVKNSESPAWLKNRLEAVGQKSISALVDITNYITLEFGRPLHVFDADKLKGNITVRAAKAGESLLALNGKTYELPAGAVVIADEAGAQSIGGIMGGESTGCTAETKNVFLEVALFSPEAIARTGRALQVDSDARYRFERGIDVAFVEEGAKLAVALITQLCGGQASALTHAGATPQWKRTVAFNPARVASLGGVDVSAERCNAILTALGFEVQAAGVVPPSWRADIEGEADLVEEVLRIVGYDNIPYAPLPKLPGTPAPALSTQQKRAHIAKRLLAGRGMMELRTWSFLSAQQAALFGGSNPALTLLNPISTDLDTMRPSLLPNLLDAAKRNAFRGTASSRFFEVGLQFSDITPTGQALMVSSLNTGGATANAYPQQNFQHSTRAYDVFDAKADALAVLEAFGLSKCEITRSAPGYYHPGRSGAFTLGKNVLGYFGEIHPSIAAFYDLGQDGNGLSAFEIFVDAIPTPRAKSKAKAALKLSDYQAVTRDFAFIVDAGVSAADIIKTINAAEKTLITNVSIFDVYSGKGVDEGKKSVAVSVTLQSFERTLAEADITAVSSAIVTAAAKGFGGALRQ
jgi:phenylalanyl-tRNA synthetase beta chain